MTKRIQFNVGDVSGDRIISFRDIDITVVGESNTVTLTNKTIDANNNTLLNITNTNIISNAAIDATKIADGSVNNTEFQYLNGATSNIQTQINTHVDDFNNPHQVTKAQVGLGNVENTKVNLTATTDPTSSDDNTEGYSIGSTWINTTTDKIYIAADVTTGGAIWKAIVDNDEIDIDVVPSNIDILSLQNAPSSAVVGISDTQTLTNKTIDADLNTITNIDNDDITALFFIFGHFIL
jgi:hypothetical protein